MLLKNSYDESNRKPQTTQNMVRTLNFTVDE